MELYLIRHTSVDVPSGYAYGHTDVPLRDSFETEAEGVKQRLAGISFDAVWCSPLTRCVRLATYCGFADACREDRIKELHFGAWEHTSWEAISADPRSVAWFDNWQQERTPGGESFTDLYNRVSSFINELRQGNYSRVALFAHGGVLAAAGVYAGRYPLSEAFQRIPAYGEVALEHF